MQIEHNPRERRETDTISWIIWPIIGLQWIGYLWFFAPDRVSIALGADTAPATSLHPPQAV
ncbi:hypothetical protein MesoLjLb_70400 [Mesorhizobium sp. L-8-3]|nr:hypothetical protein MesoLjLb_70400 [Mesorhizobium sp. L-8-3]